MTLVVLALDALDEGLIEGFGCDGFRLESAGHLQTVSHMFDDIPHTGEVWPTVATGIPPAEHGITGGGEAEWNSRLLNIASTIAGDYLNIGMTARNKLGNVVEDVTGAEWDLAMVDSPTFFDGRTREVQNWPGVHRNEEIHRIWRLLEEAAVVPRKDGESLSETEFVRKVRAIAAEQFAWCHEMLEYDLEVIGVHIHTLDAFGHAYFQDSEREKLREQYEWIESKVAALEAALGEDDELLLLSDHGMETEWLAERNDPGIHSWRAFSASTLDDRPTDVHEVREWVEANVTAVDPEDGDVGVDEDQLRQLGYLE